MAMPTNDAIYRLPIASGFSGVNFAISNCTQDTSLSGPTSGLSIMRPFLPSSLNLGAALLAATTNKDFDATYSGDGTTSTIGSEVVFDTTNTKTQLVLSRSSSISGSNRFSESIGRQRYQGM